MAVAQMHASAPFLYKIAARMKEQSFESSDLVSSSINNYMNRNSVCDMVKNC